MKRFLAMTLSAAMVLALLCACSDKGTETTVIPSDSAGAPQPVETAPLPMPTPAPAQAPAATHHPEPESTHHPEPEPTHHPEPEPTHHPEPEPTHHPEPEPTHHPETDHHDTAVSAPTSRPTPAPALTPEPTPAPAGVDLAAFYADITGRYEFGFLELASSDLLDGYYAGLTGIETEQCLVYICAMSMNNGEFGLVQVKDSGNVAAVKAIFQARIDYMAGDGDGPGGAWYPMAMDQWENNSRVVSNGNYVMMVVHENCDEIVSQFNALF